MNPSLPPARTRVVEWLADSLPDFDRQFLSTLAGDASTRCYYRYAPPQQQAVVVAAYPEPFDPSEFRYTTIQRFLGRLGVPTPRALAVQGPKGLVMQQDLGVESLLEVLATDSEAGQSRLAEAVQLASRLAIDGTIRMAAEPITDMALTQERFTWELGFFREHFLAGWCAVEAAEKLEAECRTLATLASGEPHWFCHRDYQVRNLFVDQDTLYVIDFQDAQPGPLYYDIASLLLDSVELADEEVWRHLASFKQLLADSTSPLAAAAARVANSEWDEGFSQVASQRLLKALGTYGFQMTQHGRDSYRKFVVPTLARAATWLPRAGQFPRLQKTVKQLLSSL